MLCLKRVWYRVATPTSGYDDSIVGQTFELDDCIMALIHVESQDVDRINKLVRKLVNNVSWLSRKTGINKIILHSFAHLSEDKGDPECAKKIIETAKHKLESKGLDVHVTPFGYILDLEIRIRPDTIARIFKSL